MNIEIMWTRVFKALRAVLCVVYLVPPARPQSTLEGGWGHARRQSFGDLVRHITPCSAAPVCAVDALHGSAQNRRFCMSHFAST